MRSVRADTIDDVFTGALPAAVQPNQIALALAAADEVTARHARCSDAPAAAPATSPDTVIRELDLEGVVSAGYRVLELVLGRRPS